MSDRALARVCGKGYAVYAEFGAIIKGIDTMVYIYIWPAGWSHMHHGVPSPSQIKYIITGWVNFEDMDSL